ncbi:DUF664 domain-containing protein [Flexivirga caeni]|uniref:DUF664 domain-containing protein n=1 Tax=Flexivirga caeni TaxID=2294115 RepID=A0A3M9MJ34_9MICO|nr:DUF664 domain-containing protein [Flexivirga caeni]RNI25514.1 DUF664 domain-containing protein [Flexivirga caeni]
MPAHAPQTDHEGELLAGYVTQQLLGLKAAAHGLTDAELRATPTASSLSIGSLVKHGTRCAISWLDRAAAAPAMWPPADDPTPQQDRISAHFGEFRLTPEDTGDRLRDGLDAVIARVGRDVPSYDLDERVPVPTDAPWWPRDVQSWTVRWTVLHLIEELARHAGHADIIRESIDGATMYELLGAVEGWPKSDWFTPWSRDAIRTTEPV